MIKIWEVEAECNMDASNYQTIAVKANTERKAREFAKKEFLKNNFFVKITGIKQIQGGKNE